MKTPTKRSTYAATHSGECQLCGHTQKLPGGGRLSLHGYTKQWGFFSGVCSGARGLPYETHTDLIEGEIRRQRSEIERLKEFVAEIAAPSFKDVFVQERVPMNLRGNGPSSSERRLTPAEFKVEENKYPSFSTFTLVWTVSQRLQTKGNTEQKIEGGTEFKSAKALIDAQNARKIAALNTTITQRVSYIKWLQERIAKWVKRDLTPLAADEIGTKATTLHAVNGYWSKREGRDIALCVSSIRAAGYKLTTKDNAKVTCKACLKALAAAAADKVVSEKADALIAEMVAKHGESVKVQFSDAAEAAVKELRYQRKDIDKDVRKLACDRIERGVRS